MMEFFCCDLHHSSYCPECRGELCHGRLVNGLNPDGTNKWEGENEASDNAKQRKTL